MTRIESASQGPSDAAVAAGVEVIDVLAELTPEERRKVPSANAARVYNIPVD